MFSSGSKDPGFESQSYPITFSSGEEELIGPKVLILCIINNKKTALVCFWSENIARVVLLAGKTKRQHVEWLSQAKKTMSDLSTPRTHECHFLTLNESI
jgi:hypothetical protein